MGHNWKKVDGQYRQTCELCSGKGYKEYDPRWSLHNCWDTVDAIDHPINSFSGGKAVHGGCLQKLVLCSICSRVWLYFFEQGDDSMDVPEPLYVGDKIPPDDWYPKV